MSVVDGCNHDGHVLSVSVIKKCFLDLQEKAYEIYRGKGGKKSLTAEDEQRFFMAYNASRIHLFNHVSSLNAEDNAEHISVIYEKVIDARNNLALCNSNLVHYCSKRFFKNFFDGNQRAEQHYGDAFDGLLNAVKNFNYALGYKFSTYATIAIRRVLVKCLSSYRNDVSFHELEDVNFNMDSFILNDSSFCVDERIDLISDVIDSDFNKSELKLSDMDRSILKFYVDERVNLTHDEIGKIFGVSRETIRLRKVECLKKIKSYINRSLAKK